MFDWMRDPKSEWWNVANVAGTWLASIGTILTAIVAIWLAYRDRRVELQLTATLGNEDPSQSSKEPDVLLSVRNAGRRSVTLRAVGFTMGLVPWLPHWCGLLRRDGFAVLPNTGTPRFLSALSDGEIFELTQRYHPIIFNLADALPAPHFLAQWTIRFWALTTIDERRSVRVSARLRRKIAVVAKARRKAHR